MNFMRYEFTRQLSDEELLPHLLSQNQLVLKVPGLRWQEVERQVERLGFGESFFVAETEGTRGRCCRIDPVGANPNSTGVGLQRQSSSDQ